MLAMSRPRPCAVTGPMSRVMTAAASSQLRAVSYAGYGVPVEAVGPLYRAAVPGTPWAVYAARIGRGGSADTFAWLALDGRPWAAPSAGDAYVPGGYSTRRLTLAACQEWAADTVARLTDVHPDVAEAVCDGLSFDRCGDRFGPHDDTCARGHRDWTTVASTDADRAYVAHYAAQLDRLDAAHFLAETAPASLASPADVADALADRDTLAGSGVPASSVLADDAHAGYVAPPVPVRTYPAPFLADVLRTLDTWHVSRFTTGAVVRRSFFITDPADDAAGAVSVWEDNGGPEHVYRGRLAPWADDAGRTFAHFLTDADGDAVGVAGDMRAAVARLADTDPAGVSVSYFPAPLAAY